MLKAVLFDLDNTLILFHEEEFFKTYSQKLYLSFTDILTHQDFFTKLMYSTQKMIENNGDLSNADRFIEHFAEGMNTPSKKLWERFEKFYHTEFEEFQYLMQPIDKTRDVILNIKKKGLKTVIATNPMFPTHVQHIRLGWAGLKNISFDLITSAENFNYCKPNLEYYLEICSQINEKPEDCLMVGNDPYNDIIASKTGMKTYLTTDAEHLSFELSRKLAMKMNQQTPESNFEGKLSGIIEVIEQLV